MKSPGLRTDAGHWQGFARKSHIPPTSRLRDPFARGRGQIWKSVPEGAGSGFRTAEGGPEGRRAGCPE